VTRVGIVGGGQLGLMLAEAGAGLGIECVTLDPTPDAPASRAARQIVADYDDETALAELAAASDVVTYEFENVPVSSARFLAAHVDVFPPPRSLEFTQDRLLEKAMFTDVGLGVAPYAAASSMEELGEATDQVGFPSILKTRCFGYDGKGQVPLAAPEEVPDAWRAVGEAPSILEARVPFSRELSIIGARGRDGRAVFYPLVENVHRDGILRTSMAPAVAVAAEIQASAERLALAVMERLGHVGVLAIELFDTEDGLLGNEMAPRVHNSGHWTIEGARTSQFENHLRAICGMELGDAAPSAYSAMVNLIGSEPPDQAFPARPGVHVHHYGKHARPGRKLGHVTIVEDDRDTLFSVLQEVTRTADNWE
jgi:5-(carboxyamino)imidazole ribonucleotide synthase